MKFPLALLGAFLILIPASQSDAKPRRSDGGACDSTGTGRKNGKDDQGNSVDCLWDTCTFTQCDTSGGTVSNCVKKTEYSNARDCKPAAAKGGAKGTRAPGTVKGVLQQVQ
jgi:hypothetical protein